MLQQLFTFAAQNLGREFTSFCSRTWGRLSCTLQRAVAQSILNRIDGCDVAPQAPSVGSLLGAEGPSVGEALEEGGGPLVGEAFQVAQPVGGRSAGEAVVKSEPSGLLVGECPVNEEPRSVLTPKRVVPPQIPKFPRSLEIKSKKISTSSGSSGNGSCSGGSRSCSPRRNTRSSSRSRACGVQSSQRSQSNVFINMQGGRTGRRGNIKWPDNNSNSSPTPRSLFHCKLTSPLSVQSSSSPHYSTPVSHSHTITPDTHAGLPAAHRQSPSFLDLTRLWQKGECGTHSPVGGRVY